MFRVRFGILNVVTSKWILGYLFIQRMTISSISTIKGIVFCIYCSGLVNVLTAKAMGASKIIITDVMENRLEAAKAMGATHVYKV